MKKKRFLWPDVIRIIAIFLVIIIHNNPIILSLPTPLSIDWWAALIYEYTARVCVPLFVMLSGALLLGKQESYRTFFEKRLIRVIIPWFGWTAIYMVWNIYSRNIHPHSFYSFVQYGYMTLFSQFWFLPMLVGLYLITPPLRSFLHRSSRHHAWYLVCLWFFLVSFLPFLHIMLTSNVIWNNSYIVHHVGYFILGYLLVTQNFNYKYYKLALILFLFSTTIAVVGTCLFFIATGKIVTFFDMDISPFTIIATSSLFIFLHLMFKKREQRISKKIKKIVYITSNASFGIFLFHELFIDAYAKGLMGFRREDLDWLGILLATPIKSFVVFLFSLTVILIVKKIPFIKYLAP